MDNNRTGDDSLTVIGLTGLVNSGATAAVWYFFLGDSIKNNKYFFVWYAWFVVFVVHLILWGPITIFWPLAYIGDINLLTTIDLWFQVTIYGGAYSGYGICLILLVIGMGINYDKGWKNEVWLAWILIVAYLLEAGLSSFLSIWFYP